MTKLKEIWKPVKGFESRYKISSLGRLVSIFKYHSRIIYCCDDDKGYLNTTLRNGKQMKKCYRLHTIVADNFLKKTKYRREDRNRPY